MDGARLAFLPRVAVELKILRRFLSRYGLASGLLITEDGRARGAQSHGGLSGEDSNVDLLRAAVPPYLTWHLHDVPYSLARTFYPRAPERDRSFSESSTRFRCTFALSLPLSLFFRPTLPGRSFAGIRATCRRALGTKMYHESLNPIYRE